MTKTRYRIDLARDLPESLREVVEMIEAEGRKIVSIIWQPTRIVAGGLGDSHEVSSGYVLVSEPAFT
jgi:hypothetical protein